MKIPIKKIEEVTGFKVKKNFISLGLDWATRAGVSYIQTNNKEVIIDYSFVEFKGNEPKEKRKLMVKSLEDIVGSNINLAVVEDVFIGYSRGGSLELAKYHAFAISESIRKNVEYETILATTCRSKLGIKTTKKAGYGKGKSKLAVADWLKNNLGIVLDDEDASDAIILALVGILIGMDYRSAAEIKKDKKKC